MNSWGRYAPTSLQLQKVTKMQTATENNWFKLFALMVVGGVAKALFTSPRPIYNQTIVRPEEEKDEQPPTIRPPYSE